MIFLKTPRFMLLILLSLSFLVVGSVTATEPTSFDTYDQTLFLDSDWYRELQVSTADLWNGGLDGQSGMNSYSPEFNGFFKINLDRKWKSTPGSSTAVAQSRGIYMNAEAFRAAGPEEGERFLKAVRQGADFLLEHFLDEKNGGFYWSIYSNGRVDDNMKQGYGFIHSIFALSHAYSVTQDEKYLQAALDQLTVFDEHFRNRDFACALYPSFSRNWTEIIGVPNVDIFTHYFETLLALHDVTEGDQRAKIDEQITICGDFLVDVLYHDQEGFTDRGYVAYNYDENWQPSQIPYTRDLQWAGALHATTGHNIELAWLISRAVERGFNEDWLVTADKLITFCLEYAIDPETGGMLYDITDYEGKPVEGNPDNELYLWWPQTETARALLHFAVVRGRDDLIEPYKKVETLVQATLTDQEYGGLYSALDRTTLQPPWTNKADIWKVNYHDAMYFAEAIRLGELYPERLEALSAVPVNQ